jgi:hypothetical protein
MIRLFSLSTVATAGLLREPGSQAALSANGDERFFLRVAIVISLLIAAGFSFQLLMGRSSFTSPPRVHIHAILFMGWTAIFLLQNFLAASGRLQYHRKLGWLACGWMAAMVISGLWVTAVMVRNGTVPFFFQPLHFLVFDPLAVLTVAGITIAAVRMRRQTDWHRRLHFCSMAILIGPALGRLLPMPLIQPWAWEATFVVSLVLLLVLIRLDTQRRGTRHPAWSRGLAVLLGVFVLTEAITYSPVGLAIYQRVTKGSPGAEVAPLEFGAPPPGKQITGRS